jgi:hypothetical protein
MSSRQAGRVLAIMTGMDDVPARHQVRRQHVDHTGIGVYDEQRLGSSVHVPRIPLAARSGPRWHLKPLKRLRSPQRSGGS